jgi:hypothetical protein
MGKSLREKILEDHLLIFLHIGKAGGSTLHDILQKQYEGVESYFTVGGPNNDDYGKVGRLSEKEKSDIGIVRGHVNFGVHEFFQKTPVYITMLRDPVDRIISAYYFAKINKGHSLHDQLVSGNWTLNDFVTKGSDSDNSQTRVLIGSSDIYSFVNKGMQRIPFGECTLEHLETAKRNLRSFAAVGLTERFNESIILYKRILGWDSPPVYIKQNVGICRPRKDDIPEETLNLIEKYNELDIELYRYATELFDKQISRQDASFQTELYYFSLLNMEYQHNHKLSNEYHKLEGLRAVKIAIKLRDYPLIQRTVKAVCNFLDKTRAN